MSAFTEFLCIAVALYLWESTLWLPLRSIALRRRWRSIRWQALDPGGLVAMRELGMIAMLPLPPDGGLAPCQAPPLLVTKEGAFLMETSTGVLRKFESVSWENLREKDHHLVVGAERTRISSPRCVEVLRRAKNRGATPEAAVRLAWRLALSPARAGREWRRWRLVSGSLRWYGPVLTLGVLLGLPLAFLYLEALQVGLVALWLWLMMACVAAHLWWLGGRVYPAARSALRMDAVLALVVPFHAMRALEIAAVHATGATHPAGLILSSRDLENPWLGRFVRRVLHPRPGVEEDAGFSSALLEPLTAALAGCGKTPRDFDRVPDHADDPAATGYCPRCHAHFLDPVTICPDCRGLPLRRFP